jgi:CubicO group peptidase (beta-lactamase class C family)
MSVGKSSGGFDPIRLAHLRKTVEEDIAAGKYLGAVIRIARHGEVAFERAVGFGDRERTRPLAADSVFTILSVTKAFTNVLALRAIELGRFSLTTKVSQIIPEFGAGLREHITVFHLLTHTSGLPMIFTPKPGMYIDRLDEMVAAVCSTVQAVEPAGERVAYSPLCNQLLLGEMIRRTDPQQRAFRDIVRQDLFAPLRMQDCSIGLRADLRPRHVPIEFLSPAPMEHLGHSNLGPHGAFQEENAEMPWVGAVATVPDLFRFAEMLRLRGTLEGTRIVSPATLQLATQNWTGERPNELYKILAHKREWEPSPAYIGLGFSLRGTRVCNHSFGTLTTPGTFGNYGAGSALYWVDPERQITFVCLSTGIMENNDNIVRFQRLSDIVSSAAL